jgi:hypothetical protein
VAECMIKSAPHLNGFISGGGANVASTATTAPRECAVAARDLRSKCVPNGLMGVSSQSKSPADNSDSFSRGRISCC